MSESSPAAPPPPARPEPGALKWVLIAAVASAVLVGYLLLPIREWVQSGLAFIESAGFWAPFIFVLFYAALTVLFVSGGLLTLFAGGFFGLTKGVLIVMIASNLGAALAFLVGRYFAQDWVSRKIENYPAFKAIETAVAQEGWKIVGLTRLSPVFPFVFLNYAYGLTNVKFTHYLAASVVGMLPGTFMYVYLGALAKAGAEGNGKTPAEWALYLVGLLATVAVTVFITKRARRALQSKTHLDAKSDA